MFSKILISIKLFLYEKMLSTKCSSGNRALKISLNLEKFPFLKCSSGNRAVIFLGNFQEIPGSFLETVRVGTFLVFSRKFPKKCASGYVPPHKYVKAGVSPVSNSKCALEKFPRIRKVSFSKVCEC